MIQRAQLKRHFTALELLGLMIAAICHDLDHRGTNNTFEDLTGSDLSKLYTTSTMERHHFDMAVIILNCEENNILINLSVEEYQEVIGTIEHAILATDIGTYLKVRSEYQTLLDTNTFSWKIQSHRRLAMAMLMTAADLSAITRPWHTQQRIAEVVYTEFYEQGDKEREIGHIPAELYDASNSENLPKMQIGFIDFIGMPVYVSLAKHFTELEVIFCIKKVPNATACAHPCSEALAHAVCLLSNRALPRPRLLGRWLTRPTSVCLFVLPCSLFFAAALVSA